MFCNGKFQQVKITLNKILKMVVFLILILYYFNLTNLEEMKMHILESFYSCPKILNEFKIKYKNKALFANKEN